MVKYHVSCFDSAYIFLIVSIVFHTVGSGYLARSGMHYFDAAKDGTVGQEFVTCSGCMDNNQRIDAYTESFQVSLHTQTTSLSLAR